VSKQIVLIEYGTYNNLNIDMDIEINGPTAAIRGLKFCHRL